MNEIINTITDGLFSVFVSLGSIPIIKCPKGTAAEMVAERLDKKIRENLRDTRNTLFMNDTVSSLSQMSPMMSSNASSSNLVAAQLSFQRPLLILLDRNFDMATPFHHTWTYQALLHDTFNFQLNRIELNTAAQGAAAKEMKKYDLLNTDKFWKLQKGNPFPVVAESIQDELEKYKQCEVEIKKFRENMVSQHTFTY